MTGIPSSAPPAASGSMPHVFLSYVREDTPRVLRLAEALRARGIPVWMDTAQITVGDDWWRRITDAIRRAGFFVACFSAELAQRERTVMNQEIRFAIGEQQVRPYGKPWLLPVRLDPCEVPSMSLGGGETLDRLHVLDLHPDFETGAAHLADVILGHGASSAPVESGRVAPLPARNGTGAPAAPPVLPAPAPPPVSAGPHTSVVLGTVRAQGEIDFVNSDGAPDASAESGRMDVNIGDVDCGSISFANVRRRGG